MLRDDAQRCSTAWVDARLVLAGALAGVKTGPAGIVGRRRCTIDIDYLIDRLEELLDRSARIPYTSRVIIDEGEYLRLVDQMRISVPQEIKNARQIEAEREARLGAAQEQVEAMIVAAGEKAEALTSEHAIRAKAQTQAEEIIAKAIEEASEIRSDADAYALEVLQRIAVQLDGFGRTVQNGIRHLQVGGRVEPGGDDAGPAAVVGGPGDRIDQSARQG